MSEISKQSGPNFTDIKKLEYVFQDDILNDEIDLTDLIVTINLKDGAYWKEIYFTPGSVSHELDKENKSGAGTRYDQFIGIREPKVSNTLSALFFKMKGRPVVLKITDNNNNIFLMGTAVHFCQVKTPAKTTGSYHGYTVEFSVSLPHPLPFIQTWQEAQNPAGGEET